MDDFLSYFGLGLAVLAWLILWLAPVVAVIVLAYKIVSLPLRRRERARAFLTLVETGVNEGQRVENRLVSIADTRDPGLGNAFHRLAAALRQGQRLGDALDRVPQFVPPQVTAMLKAGERLGDLRKVLPACRQLLKDPLAITRGPLNYMLSAAFFTTPLIIAILALMENAVVPKMQDIVSDMGIPTSAGIALLLNYRGTLFLLVFLLLAIVWLTAFIYIGGPAVSLSSGEHFSFATDRLFYALPWRRKRMERDFAVMLAILLDNGVPEAEALTLAADCTANRVFKQRAERAVAALKQGMKLTEAVQLMDDTGEFRWRLANAVHAHGGFFKALAGWNEALDARAFQQEQATAQAVTTGLVLLNGIFVGLIVISVFGVIISIINAGLAM